MCDINTNIMLDFFKIATNINFGYISCVVFGVVGGVKHPNLLLSTNGYPLPTPPYYVNDMFGLTYTVFDT